LKWHLANGTRPEGTQKQWTNQKFAEAVQSDLTDKAIRNWQLGQNLPRKLDNVERALFGEKPTPQQHKWRDELRATYTAAKGMKGDAVAISKSQTSMDVLRGSDFCVFMVVGPQHPSGKWPLMSVNHNCLPVYDVYMRIRGNVDAPFDSPEDMRKLLEYMSEVKQIELGTIPYGVKMFDIFLEPGHYQIDIRTRYGKYTEMLKFSPFNGDIGQSRIVRDLQGNMLDQLTLPDGYTPIY
jgi:hypothetical protein